MPKPFKLLWLDMEMTGLDVEKEVPIEVAAIATASPSQGEFKELGVYHAVVKQAPSHLAAMDEWNQRQHRESGLFDLVPSGTPMAEVDAQLAAFIQTHFGAERAVLCGNSIPQDRLFIRRYLPKTEAVLHYRMVDVTSWKVIYNELFDLRFKKKDGHRALDDIRESLAELKFYMTYVDPLRHPVA